MSLPELINSPNTFDGSVIEITIPIGETVSDMVELGQFTMLGFWINGFVGSITFSGYRNNLGKNIYGSDMKDPNITIGDLAFAGIQSPDGTNGADYSVTVSGVTDMRYVPVNHLLFIPNHFIKFNISVAVTQPVVIEIYPYLFH